MISFVIFLVKIVPWSKATKRHTVSIPSALFSFLFYSVFLRKFQSEILKELVKYFNVFFIYLFSRREQNNIYLQMVGNDKDQ